MKVKIPVEKIREDLQVAGLLARKNSTNLISSNIEFIVKSGELVLKATNGILFFRSKVDVELDKTLNFSYYINSIQLLNIVKKMREGNFTLEFSQHNCILKYKRFELILDVIPIITEKREIKFKPIFEKTLCKEDLKEFLKALKLYSNKTVYDVMSSGMWVKCEDKISFLLFTDRKMIYIKKIPERLPDRFGTLISIDTLSVLANYDTEKIEMKLNHDMCKFEMEDRLLESSTLNTKLPSNMLAIVSKMTDSDKYIHLNKEILSSAISFVKPYADGFKEKADITFEEDAITLKCENATIKVECSIVGKMPKRISININILDKLIQGVSEDEFDLCLDKSNKALHHKTDNGNTIVIGMLLSAGR